MASSKRWWTLIAIAASLLVVALDSTVLTVALPTIAVDLDATNAQLQWFADAYLLVLAALLLPAGLLGDRFGRKRLTLAALAVFGAGSLWCALASSAGELIAARAVLGIGAAALIPMAMSSVIVLFEPSERGKAVSVLGAATMLGLPAGPLVGGVLLQHFWWGSVFLVNLPVIAIALLATAVLMPADAPTAGRGRFDLVGVLLSAIGLVGLTYGLIEGAERGWSDPTVLAALAGGVAVLLAFVLWERHTAAEPVMDLALWRNRAFGWGTASATLVSFAFFGVMFVVPQYLHTVQGADAMATGVWLLPLVGGMIFGLPLALAIGARVPIRIPVSVGFLVMAAGLVLGANTSVGDGFGALALWTALVGAGCGAALIGAQTVALNTLDRTHAGAGSALVQTMRQVGSVFGIAVLGAVLGGVYRGTVDTTGLPPVLADVVTANPAAGIEVAGRLPAPDLADSVRSAFVDGMSATLWICAGVAALSALVAWLMPAVSGTPRPEVPEDPAEVAAAEAQSGDGSPEVSAATGAGDDAARPVVRTAR